jgi:hypothetical protein
VVVAGGDDDVQLRDLLVDPLDAGNVPAASPHRRVHEGAHALGRHRAEPGDRVRDPLLLVPPAGAVVLEILGADEEHVLVHQGRSEVGDLDGSSYGLDSGHGCLRGIRTIF